LGDLCARYAVPLTRAHDAGADAAATAAVLPKLLVDAHITELAELEPFLAGRTTAWPRVP
jgi:DNA polymerase III epsilon subunit-like protein